MSVNTFLSDLKQFFIDSFTSPVYQDGVLYFIIEELPNPRDTGVFKILCGSTQIALDAVALDEPGVVIANQLIGLQKNREQQKSLPQSFKNPVINYMFNTDMSTNFHPSVGPLETTRFTLDE